MSVRRLPWILLATLLAVGCRNQQVDTIPPPTYEDDFGETIEAEEDEELTVESVGEEQMIRQRAQLELRLGARQPADVLNPDVSPINNIGPAAGVKFAFEVAKNIFIDAAFDWSHHTVDDQGETSGNFQLGQIDNFDRFNILVGLDYDIPLVDLDLWGEARSLLLRLGAAAGVNIVKFDERESSINTFETFVGFVFRPSVGLRLPLNDYLLVFTEVTYDLIPTRNLETNETATVTGEDAIFSGVGFWGGVAFEWD